MLQGKKVILLMSIIALSCLKSFGQMIKLQVQDTALQSKTLFVVVSRSAPIQPFKPIFDNKGFAVFMDTCSYADKKSFLAIDNQLKQLYTSKESSTTIKVCRKNEKSPLSFQYKGDANDIYVLNDSMASGFSFPKYFSLLGDKSETLKNYDKKIAMLETYRKNLLQQAQSLREKDMVSTFSKSIECEYLRYKLSLMHAYDKAHDIDVLEDKAYQALLDKIDVNDSVYESYSLISQYLKGKVSSKLENAPVEWGCEFLKQIGKYISNNQLKRQMELQAIQYVITYATGDEIDKFWVPFKNTADSVIVNAFSAKIESMKHTKAGMQAYNTEFCDAEGTIHRFSDYKGKLLYVDFWATWCGPCKAEIPHLAKLVEHYHGNDKVQFISVSVDENVEAWKKMIAKDNPQWPQFIATKEQHKKISQDWGIVGIPRFLLINADGTINNADAIRPSDPQLMTLIDKLIK